MFSTQQHIQLYFENLRSWLIRPLIHVFVLLLHYTLLLLQCGGRFFQKTVGIPIGIICAPLLADIFRHSYESDFIADPIQKKEYCLARF